MKQQIFVIIGALIVLVLILVWVYLLFFGTPQSAQDVFSDFDLNGEVDNTVVEQPPVEEVTPVTTERPKLRQLTTKLVAGFKEVARASSTPLVYFVEKGTGHLYSIDPEDGAEIRLSGTTVPNTYQAAISTKGNYVAISSFTNSKNQTLVVGEMSTSSGALELREEFKKSVRDFSISNNDELLYSMSANSGLAGYAYDLKTSKVSDLFTLPFTEASVQWSTLGSAGSQYIYPKPSYALEGYLYEAKANKLSRLPADGFGFSAVANDDIIVYTSADGENVSSSVYDRQTGESIKFDSMVWPEKCLLPIMSRQFICAHEAVKVPFEFPDAWYSGEFSFKDTLYLLSSNDTLTAEPWVNTWTETNREIDIIDMQLGEFGKSLYFINKNDNSLWLYEI